jgi:hypothetical protein
MDNRIAGSFTPPKRHVGLHDSERSRAIGIGGAQGIRQNLKPVSAVPSKVLVETQAGVSRGLTVRVYAIPLSSLSSASQLAVISD